MSDGLFAGYEKRVMPSRGLLTLVEDASRADLRRGGDIAFSNGCDQDLTKLCKL